MAIPAPAGEPPPEPQGGTGRRWTTGDVVVLASGLGLLLVSFLPWFGHDIPNAPDYTETAWNDLLPILSVVSGVAVVVALLVTKLLDARGARRPPNDVFLLAGATVFVLLVVKLLVGGEESGVDLDNRTGAFLGAIAGGGLALGGWLKSGERPGTAGSPGGRGGPPPA